MSVSSREAETKKTGLWYVVIQGIPVAFGMVANHPETVPVSINRILRRGSDLNIAEIGAEIKACIKFAPSATDCLPDIGPYTIERYEARVHTGDFRLTLSDDADNTLKSLGAYLSEPVTFLRASLPETIEETSTVYVASVSKFSQGDVIYIGAETLRVETINTEERSLTCSRGLFGSERKSYVKRSGVYKTPPFWCGRRMALVRTFIEESTGEYEIRWVGNVQGFYADKDGNQFVLSGNDELKTIDKNVKIKGHGNLYEAESLGAPFNYYILKISTGDDTGNDGAFSFTTLQKQRYLQIGKSIVRAFDFSADIDGDKLTNIELKVSKDEVGCFGTEPLFESADFTPDESGRNIFTSNGDGKEAHQLIVFQDEHLLCGDEENESVEGIALKLLQSDAGNLSNGHYDLLTVGAGLHEDEIDLEAFSQARDRNPDLKGTLFLGWNGEEFNLRDVIEEYCLAPLWGHLIPQSNGKISLRYPFELTPLYGGKFDIKIEDMDFDKGVEASYSEELPITDLSAQFARNVYGAEERIGDFLPMTFNVELSEAVQFYQLYRLAQNLKMYACTADTAGREYTTRRSELLKLRDMRPLPHITVWIRLKYWYVEVGDIVRLFLDDIPLYSPKNGSITIPNGIRCEVLRKEYELNDELIRVVLLPIDLSSRRIGVIAPSAKITGFGSSKKYIYTEEHFFSSGEYDEESTQGGEDCRHFKAGDCIRFYRPQTGEWFAAPSINRVANVDSNANLIEVEAEVSEILEGDIIEYAEYPYVSESSNNREWQEGHVFLADDGLKSVTESPDGDEKIPSAYEPVTVYDIEPYFIAIDL